MIETIPDINLREAVANISYIARQLPGVIIIHNLYGSVVWMSDRGLQLLGLTQEEIRNFTAEDYYGSFFNAEDAKDYVPKILGLLERNNDDEFCTYFQQVRYKGQTNWTWHMSSVKIFTRDDQGNPLSTITMAFPFNAMHHMTTKAERLLEENNFLRKNFHRFASLSKREAEILRLMAMGKSAAETANDLFIAVGTVETHRKNIKSKLNTNSYYILCQYARAFDLI